MSIKSISHAFSLMVLLVSPALSLAGDDMYDEQKDVAEERYEKAKESCEKFKDEAQDACEATAKADYERELLALKKQHQDREEPDNPMPSE